MPLALTLLILFSQCKKSTTSQALSGKGVPIYGCKNFGPQVYMCFDSLLLHVRCPKNAYCIWAGTSLIKVSFHENGNTHQFKMTYLSPWQHISNDTMINGYKIVFTDIQTLDNINAPNVHPGEAEAFFNITQ